MSRLGSNAGIVFRYGGRVGRTADAHRLVRAAPLEVADALVEGLLRAFHEEERDIADRTVLREIATAAGMKGEDVERAFGDGDVARAVDEEEGYWRGRVEGKGVPVYLVRSDGEEEEMRVDGSQDPGAWYELFVSIKEGQGVEI